LTRIYAAPHTFIGLADADAGRLQPRRLIATQQA
jgi:tRNA pseudouridine55 synthase